MKTPALTAVAIAVASAAAGGFGRSPRRVRDAGRVGRAAPSPLIYPAETIPIAFDHAQHARLGATCESCHVSALTSTSAGDNLIPREAACRGCHKIDRDQPAKPVPHGAGGRALRRLPRRRQRQPAGCRGHAGMAAEPPRVVLARPNLKFNHKLHAARGIACALCHASADMAQAPVTRADLPMMATCLGCHDGKQATARCSACHLTEPDGRLKTKLVSVATMAAGGTGPLVPSGSLRGIDAPRADVQARPRAGRARREATASPATSATTASTATAASCGRPTSTRPTTSRCTWSTRAGTCPTARLATALQSFCVGCHQRLGRRLRSRGWAARAAPEQPVRHRDRPQDASTRPGWVARRGRRRDFQPAPEQPFAGRPAQHPHLRLLPPRGELPRLPFGGPDARADHLAPRPEFPRHGALSVPGGPKQARLPQVPRRWVRRN